MKKQIKNLLLFFIIASLPTSCNSQTTKQSNSEPKKSIAEAISILPNATIQETITHYYKLKKEHFSVYNFDDENELNKLGYQYLNNGETKSAVEIFKLLVSEFPNSSNPYDSLGEAYYKNNDLEQSVKNYQKSLKLNPDNANAAQWIDRIKYPTIDTTKFYKVYPKQQYIDDIEELANTITTRNPHPYKYMVKEDFWNVVEDKKRLIHDTTTFSEFIWHCSEIIANLNCGHSGLGYFNQETAMLPIELRFPLDVKLIEDKLFVSDPLINKDIIEAGIEIVEINGKSIAEIKNDVYKHIKSQAKVESFKRLLFNGYSTAYIPYSFGFPESYNVLLAGNNKPVLLNKLTTYKPKPRIHPENKCQDNLCLDLIDETKTAVITIRSFAYYGNKFLTYKKFIDESFQKMRSKGFKNLIIDVRMNGGGPSDAGIYLLRYIAKEQFVYFKSSAFNEKKEFFEPFENQFNGKVYGIIDGGGGSTTGHFMSLVKHLNLATLVGEELGSNQFCTGGQISFRLPNTEIFYAVGRYTYVTTADSVSDERGVMPDHHVVQSINDYLNNIDTVLEYTKVLIDNE